MRNGLMTSLQCQQAIVFKFSENVVEEAILCNSMATRHSLLNLTLINRHESGRFIPIIPHIVFINLEKQYRRSEKSCSGPGRAARIAKLAASKTTLFLPPLPLRHHV